ncbi:MAG: transposase [Hyphomicrobiales bacterium]
MGGRRSYSDETKAAVKAALLQGQGVTAVAKEYNIPKSTVANWKADAVAGSNVPNEKKAEIGDLLVDLSDLFVIEIVAISTHLAAAHLE